MSSVRPAYIKVYQRILTDNKYTVFNFACVLSKAFDSLLKLDAYGVFEDSYMLLARNFQE